MEWEQQTRGDPLPRGVTQVCAAWVEIICNPSYSGEYRINFISSLILPILLRNWSYITEAVPMCWSQKGDLWLWLVSSEPRANSPASYSIRAIYYSCVLQYWRICKGTSWLLPCAVKGSSWYPLVIWWRPRIMRLTVFALATSPMLV